MSSVRGVPEAPRSLPKRPIIPVPEGAGWREKRRIKEEQRDSDARYYQESNRPRNPGHWSNPYAFRNYFKQCVGLNPDSAHVNEGGELSAYGNQTLATAAKTRYGKYRYTDPAEYVAHLWADGFIDDDRADGLLQELKENNGIPGDTVKAFLRDECARGHVQVDEYEAMKSHDIAIRKPPNRRDADMAEIRGKVLRMLRESGLSLPEAALEGKELLRGIGMGGDTPDLPAAGSAAQREQARRNRDNRSQER